MKIARNVAANYLGRGFSIAAIYLFTPAYIKILGLAAYGVISFNAIILAVGTLVDSGLTATLSREAAKRKDRVELLNLTTTIERCIVIASSAFALMVVALAEPIARQWLGTTAGLPLRSITHAIQLMALAVPAQLCVSLYVGGLLGLQQQDTGNAVQAMFVMARSGLVIPAIAWNPSLEVFFGWQLGVSVVMAVIARAIFVRTLGFRPYKLGEARLASLRPMMHFAGGMLALTALAGINTQIDKLVVSRLFPLEQFGTYTLASALSQIPYAAIAPLMLAMQPRLTELIAQGAENEASAIYDLFQKFVGLIAGFGSFGLIFFAPDILEIWLQVDTADESMVNIVRVTAFGTLFLALSAMPFYLGLSNGHNRTSVITGIFTAIATVPLILIATRHLGLVGAAVPWVLINLSSFVVLSWHLTRKYYRGSSSPTLIGLGLSFYAAATLAIARLVSDALAFPPLATCLCAALVSAIAISLLAIFRRDRFKTWRP